MKKLLFLIYRLSKIQNVESVEYRIKSTKHLEVISLSFSDEYLEAVYKIRPFDSSNFDYSIGSILHFYFD